LQIEGITPRAAEAVENVYALMAGKGTLAKIFERNFK